jgi:hypothetical protein
VGEKVAKYGSSQVVDGNGNFKAPLTLKGYSCTISHFSQNHC